MSILTEAIQDNAYFKAAIRGLSGSGKSFTAANWAIGLHKYIGSNKPIAYWDTEAALPYLLPHFKHNGIKVLELRSRAFKDSKEFFKEAQEHCDIAIIDSVTHLWEDLLESYQRAKNLKRIAFHHWGIIKPMWRNNMLHYILDSKLHLIVCGRLSDIFQYIEVDGETVLATVGSKMTAEKSTEYEPSLTVEMEKFTISDEELKKMARALKEGAPVKALNKVSRYRMTIIKDRANVLSGKIFVFEPSPGGFIEPDNMPFDAIKPHLEALNIGVEARPVTDRTSEDVFEDNDFNVAEYNRQRNIILENIKSEFTIRFTNSAVDRQEKVRLVKEVFGTASWTAIESMSLEELQNGYDKLMAIFYPNREDNNESGMEDGDRTDDTEEV